jgi:hypothetical protein
MKNISLAKKTQSWINQIKAYQKTAPELYNEGTKKFDFEFNINHYFDILKNIKLEEGWLADYLYFKDRLGGEPVLISYPKSKREEYVEIIKKIYDTKLEEIKRNSYSEDEDIVEQFFNKEDVNNYLDHVKLDGSEESYLQFLILAALGSQFSLFWHAAYNDKEFVCTIEKAEKIIKRINRSKQEMSFKEDDIFDQQLGEIDFDPQITINTDKVTVRLVFFTKWGGFIEAKYQVKKDFPHKIIERETETLIDYNCGYVY